MGHKKLIQPSITSAASRTICWSCWSRRSRPWIKI